MLIPLAAVRIRKCKGQTNLLGSLNPGPAWDVQQSDAYSMKGISISLGAGRIKWQDTGRSDIHPYFESVKKNSRLQSAPAEHTDRHL